MSGLGSENTGVVRNTGGKMKDNKNCNSLDVGRQTGGRSKYTSYTSYNPSVMRQTIE